MALIACPECGKQVSDKASACPKCAHPLSSPPAPPGRIAGMASRPLRLRPVGILIGLMLLGGGVLMFSTMDLSGKGQLIAGVLCILGITELITGSAKRAKIEGAVS